MADIKLYLAELTTSRKAASDIAQKSAEQLQKNKTSLLGLVESLDQYLNNEDSATRAQALAYLAEVLTNVPKSTYSLQARDLLTEFIATRITAHADGVAVGVAANCLSTMENKGKWSREIASLVLTNLVEKINPLRQVRRPSDRYNVLRLVDLIFREYRSVAFQQYEQSPVFMDKFIALFEGEKDPRNLMIVFSVLKVPMSEWPVQEHAKGLFELVFNYFPITFRPPPDDPYGITAQDLKERLRECIAACPYFAPHSFPALLDKLDSVSINTKRDSLNAIKECVSNYGPGCVSRYAAQIWHGLKSEIINVQEDELADLSLAALAQIAEQDASWSMSRDERKTETDFFSTVARECNEHLQDAPTKQSKAASRVLEVLSATSPVAASFMLRTVIPEIITLFGASSAISKRRSLIETLVQLLRSVAKTFGDWVQGLVPGSVQVKNPILVHGETLLEMFRTAFLSSPEQEVSYKIVAIDGLARLGNVRGLLQEHQLSTILNLLLDAVLSDGKTADQLRIAAIDGLVSIARQRPQLVIEQAFPRFLAALPDADPGSKLEYLPVLDAFSRLGKEESVFDTVILRLKNRLDDAIRINASPRYIQILLSSILFVLQNTNSDLDPRAENKLFTGLVCPLIGHVTASQRGNSNFLNAGVYELVGRICAIVIKRQTAEFQKQHLTKDVQTLLEIPDVPGALDSLETNAFLIKMVVATYVLAGIRRTVEPISNVSSLLRRLVTIGLNPRIHFYFRTNVLKQLSIVLNKFISSENAAEGVRITCIEPLELFNSGKEKEEAMGVLLASMRALLLRNEPRVVELLPALVSMLEDEECGRAVAHAYTALLQPDDLLVIQNDCKISSLSKQKVFAILCPKIIERFQTAQKGSNVKSNYAIALSGLVQWVPLPVLESKLETVFPVLLQTLDLQNEFPTKLASLATIQSLIQSRPAMVEGYAQSLIPRLIKSTSPRTSKANAIGSFNCNSKSLSSSPQPLASSPVEKGSGLDVTSVRVRVAALECLQSLTRSFGLVVLMPYVSEVMAELVAALDDEVRAVRAAAVVCRTWWADLQERADLEEGD